MKVETHDDITDETQIVNIPDIYDPAEIVKATDMALGNPEGLVEYDEITVKPDGTIVASANTDTMHPMTATFRVLSN